TGIPKEYVLYQNYPNPFNPSTIIRFGLPERSLLNICIYNILGERVAILFEGDSGGGYHEIVWAPTALASGVYFAVIDAHAVANPSRTFHSTKRALYIR
ncbi:MAG TPA: T9SS type A sorting domain-containing protein, partial [Bacteroidota bacterium]|nr:T9SS type A sorting domain-containing protein [Bacteroidota bacterium]